jgi:hypothetical protein
MHLHARAGQIEVCHVRIKLTKCWMPVVCGAQLVNWCALDFVWYRAVRNWENLNDFSALLADVGGLAVV